MTVTVLLFSALRDRAGRADVTVTVPDGTAVDGVWPWLPEAIRRDVAPPGVRYARNDDWAAPTTPLTAGDTLALMLPVSGG
jgi:molybdopterin converting factor small subunit